MTEVVLTLLNFNSSILSTDNDILSKQITAKDAWTGVLKVAGTIGWTTLATVHTCADFLSTCTPSEIESRECRGM